MSFVCVYYLALLQGRARV